MSVKNNRRELFKTLAVSGAVIAVPESWVKPAIKSTVIPAHAQSTIPMVEEEPLLSIPDSDFSGFSNPISVASNDIFDASDISDILISQSHAAIAGFRMMISVTNDTADCFLRDDNTAIGYEGIGSINSPIAVGPDCGEFENLAVTITDGNGSAVQGNINGEYNGNPFAAVFNLGAGLGKKIPSKKCAKKKKEVVAKTSNAGTDLNRATRNRRGKMIGVKKKIA